MKSKLLLVFLCLSIPLITGLAQETRTVDYEDLFWRRALHTDERYLVFATVDDLDCREPGCERQLVVVDRQDEQVQYTLDYTRILNLLSVHRVIVLLWYVWMENPVLRRMM